jgi:hypothetical protein
VASYPEAERQDLHGHWPNVKEKLPNMARVVVVLLRKCDDELKGGFSLFRTSPK